MAERASGQEPRRPARRGALRGDNALVDRFLRQAAQRDQQRQGGVQTEVDRTPLKENVDQN